MIRLQITGDRNWKNYAIIHNVIDDFLITSDEEVVVVEGEADGADRLAEIATRDLQACGYNVSVDPHPARWYRKDAKGNTFFFKGAGPERNDEMLDLEPRASLVLAFHNKILESKGTRHCVLGAIRRRLPVQLFTETEESHIRPSAYAVSFIPPQSGRRPEVILQEAVDHLHPLTW